MTFKDPAPTLLVEGLPPTPPGQTSTVKLTNSELDQLIIVCSAQFKILISSLYLCLFEFILSASLLLLVMVNKVMKNGFQREKIVYLNNVLGII